MSTHEEIIRLYFSRDRIAEALGIELLEFSNGTARCRMVVRDIHMNGLDIVHGASMFALADFAFAVASNSHGTQAVAINAQISIVKAVTSGTLYAEAKERTLSNKLGTYDIEITNEADEVVALFHGMVYRKKDTVASHVLAHQEG